MQELRGLRDLAIHVVQPISDEVQEEGCSALVSMLNPGFCLGFGVWDSGFRVLGVGVCFRNNLQVDGTTVLNLTCWECGTTRQLWSEEERQASTYHQQPEVSHLPRFSPRLFPLNGTR